MHLMSFFSALSNLRGNANNSTIRRQAVTLGETFTNYVQNVATGLQKIQDEFLRVFRTKDLQQLARFHRQLDIIAEGYRAQSVSF